MFSNSSSKVPAAVSGGKVVLFFEYTDLVKAGVVDPKKVTRCALQNASSIAALLLTTECVIAELPEEKKPDMPPQPPPMY